MFLCETQSHARRYRTLECLISSRSVHRRLTTTVVFRPAGNACEYCYILIENR